MRRALAPVISLGLLVCGSLPAHAQGQLPAARFVGRPITSVVLRVNGEPTTDPTLQKLVETTAGEPLAMKDVRETLAHFFDLRHFQSVEVRADDAEANGVALTYEMRRLQSVAELAFAGDLGLPADELRRVVVDRYSKSPPPGRADAASRTLEQYLTRRGFLVAVVIPSIEPDPRKPDQTRLVFNVAAGVRARVGNVRISGADDPARVAERLDLREGQPFDFDRFDERVNDYARSMRRAGYYEATVDQRAVPRPNNTVVDVAVDVHRGPVVKVAIEGDPIPRSRLGELVPLEREGSADEDLLEDSDIRIQNYLLEQGYHKAQVTHRRDVSDGTETITFTVNRGARYIVSGVEIAGNTSLSREALHQLVAIRDGEPYVDRKLTEAIAAIKAAYLRLGFTSAAVDAANTEVPPPSASQEGRVAVRIVIREGVQTRVGSITMDGNTAIPAATLLAATKVRTGDPFYEPVVAADRQAVLVEYLNAGFASATVAVDPVFSADRRRIDLAYHVVEGQRVLVDQIIIIGNTKTSEATIRRELLLQPGKPLGYSALIQSQQRLTALGLFRRVRITEVAHSGDNRRDILVVVEEANRTTLAYGGGVEVTPFTVPGPDGVAEQQYDVAPRGSFEIGRRNLWGKNRSVSLFTRFSLRPRGQPTEESPSQFGINEYRIVGTYREPGAFGSRLDLSTSAFAEQAVRSTFNFRRQGFNFEGLRWLKPTVRLAVRYQLGRTELLDVERIPPDEQLAIDRLFPQIRLSTISTALYRDTRDDALDPSRGVLLAEDSDLSFRVIGSQVGFAKIFIQAFSFRKLPTRRRIIFASALRVGIARALPQEVNGELTDVDLPASERFFAGGSTTVRGFALDRLGTDATISSTGIPLGGNGVIIMNAELRVSLWRDFGVVGFMDGGNVFKTVSDFDLTELRFSPGFGLRYRSPIGPIRVDLGFKLNPRELSPGRFESATAFQISVGHAF